MIGAAWQAWQDEARAIRLAAVRELEEAEVGTVRFLADQAGRADLRLTAEGRTEALEASGAHAEARRTISCTTSSSARA